jgi:hypothetical protein
MTNIIRYNWAINFQMIDNMISSKLYDFLAKLSLYWCENHLLFIQFWIISKNEIVINFDANRDNILISPYKYFKRICMIFNN